MKKAKGYIYGFSGVIINAALGALALHAFNNGDYIITGINVVVLLGTAVIEARVYASLREVILEIGD